MHTAFELDRSMITAEKAGQPVKWEDFLDWGTRDRLGVVIDSPLGALGAGLLVLLCTIAFYDFDKRRRRRPLYAPIYLFHIGRPWGFHGEFDFWPDRKEIIVSDPTQTLPMINSHAITHLAVPERAARSVAHRYKEPEELLDILKQAFVYAPTGELREKTLTLNSTDKNVFRNFEYTVNLQQTLALREQEVLKDPQYQRDSSVAIDARRYVALMRERLTEIDYRDPAALLACQRIFDAQKQHRLSQDFAQIEPRDVLSLLD